MGCILDEFICHFFRVHDGWQGSQLWSLRFRLERLAFFAGKQGLSFGVSVVSVFVFEIFLLLCKILLGDHHKGGLKQ